CRDAADRSCSPRAAAVAASAAARHAPTRAGPSGSRRRKPRPIRSGWRRWSWTLLVERAQIDRAHEMAAQHEIAAFEIGDGAGDADGAVHGAGAETAAARPLTQRRVRVFVELTPALQVARAHLRVGVEAGAAKSQPLALARGHHPRLHDGGGIAL